MPNAASFNDYRRSELRDITSEVLRELLDGSRRYLYLYDKRHLVAAACGTMLFIIRDKQLVPIGEDIGGVLAEATRGTHYTVRRTPTTIQFNTNKLEHVVFHTDYSPPVLDEIFTSNKVGKPNERPPRTVDEYVRFIRGIDSFTNMTFVDPRGVRVVAEQEYEMPF